MTPFLFFSHFKKFSSRHQQIHQAIAQPFRRRQQRADRLSEQGTFGCAEGTQDQQAEFHRIPHLPLRN